MNERKAAHMAAYFLSKSNGHMSHLKLMKLLYLADRESLRRFDSSMTEDRMVSMKFGPVLSQTLDLINGARQSAPDGWDEWIADRANHQVSLTKGRRQISCKELGALSRADRAVLDVVWNEHGAKDQFQLADWTHLHCSEWEDPGSSAREIPFRRVMNALGKDTENAVEAERMAVLHGVMRKYVAAI